MDRSAKEAFYQGLTGTTFTEVWLSLLQLAVRIDEASCVLCQDRVGNKDPIGSVGSRTTDVVLSLAHPGGFHHSEQDCTVAIFGASRFCGRWSGASTQGEGTTGRERVVFFLQWPWRLRWVVETGIQAVLPLVSLIRPSWSSFLLGAELLGMAVLHFVSVRPQFELSGHRLSLRTGSEFLCFANGWFGCRHHEAILCSRCHFQHPVRPLGTLRRSLLFARSYCLGPSLPSSPWIFAHSPAGSPRLK